MSKQAEYGVIHHQGRWTLGWIRWELVNAGRTDEGWDTVEEADPAAPNFPTRAEAAAALAAKTGAAQ